jgi:hypothetical protein
VCRRRPKRGDNFGQIVPDIRLFTIGLRLQYVEASQGADSAS